MQQAPSQNNAPLWTQAALGLGANLGDSEATLQQAITRMQTHPHLRNVKLASVYHTAPVGNTEQPWFHNTAVLLETTLSPIALLETCLQLERDFGRFRSADNPFAKSDGGARTLDVDILFYGHVVLQSELLTLPHPAMAERAFVLSPLAELCPEWLHPVLGQNIAALNLGLSFCR